MRRAILCAAVILLLGLIFSTPCAAAEPTDSLDDLRGSISDEVYERMQELGYSGDLTLSGGLSLQKVFAGVLDALSGALSAPLSSCALMIGVILLSSLLEGYTSSLRYTETREIMNAITSLMIAAALITPLTELISRCMGVIADASSLMLVYVPIMVGIMGFSGHLVQAGGSCAVVMTASQVIAQLAAHFFPQLLCSYLALSVASGVSGRLHLGGFCEMVGKFLRWSLTFAMTVFAAVLSLQNLITRAGDTAASRAMRFTLSSLIPFIGSAISEAYKTITGSMDLLRSGAGVFVILAVFAVFLPILAQAVLWLFAVNVSKYTAEAVGVSAPGGLLSAVGTAVSTLIALIICSMAVFIISAAALMHTGGAS